MTLSRKQKVLAGVAGVGLLAVAIDRGVLGPGQAAAAPVISLPILDDSGEQTGGGSLATQTGGLDAPLTAIAEGIGRLFSREQIDPEASGDAFMTPASWTMIAPEPAASENEPVVVANLELSAAMPTRTGGIAVIDGRNYRVGDRVGVFTLEEVGARWVVLRGPSGPIRLELSR